MRKFGSLLVAIFAGILVFALNAAPAHAQATRTWVSGVGDDANPCSRTAPCKTFAGAISKTAAGGEIDCLDPGGFGAVTITKSITIDCEESGNGGVVVSGTNGIVVAPGAVFVNLRGLDINGLGTGLSGVSVTGAAAVHVKKTKIYGFTTAGINFAPGAAGGVLVVTDAVIETNAIGIILNGGGGGVNMILRDVLVHTNTSHGVSITTAGPHAGATIDRSTLAFNGGTGLLVNGGTAIALIGSSTVTGNGTGVGATGGATLRTYKNNQIFGNGSDGTPIAAVPAPGQPLQ